EVGPVRLAVEEQHRVTLTLVEVVQTEAVQLDVAGFERVPGKRLEALIWSPIDVHQRVNRSTESGLDVGTSRLSGLRWFCLSQGQDQKHAGDRDKRQEDKGGRKADQVGQAPQQRHRHAANS